MHPRPGLNFRSHGAVLAIALAISVTRLDAHLVTTGLGPVYDGIGHFFLSPDNFGTGIAVALLAGLRGPRTARMAVLTLPFCWLVGGICGGAVSWPGNYPGDVAAAVSLLILGVTIASDLSLKLYIAAALIGAVGIFNGFANGLALREAGAAEVLEQLGIFISLMVLVTLVAAVACRWRVSKFQIVARVLGSWCAAIGLLLLGWVIHARR